MIPPDHFPPDNQTELEQRLASWLPSPVASGRDRLLFEAGVAAGRRQTRRQAVVVVAALAIGSGAWIIHEHRTSSRLETALAERSSAVEQVPADHHPIPRPNLVTTSAAPSSYLALSHSYGGDDGQLDPVEPVAAQQIVPAPDEPVLTPLSSRRAGEILETLIPRRGSGAGAG